MSALAPQPVPPPTGDSDLLLKPPTVLLLGPAGVGKTYSIPTLLQCGLEVFVIGTEPNFLDTLLDSTRNRKLDVAKLHWLYIPPAAPGTTALEDMAQQVANKGYEDLAAIKQGISKDKTQQFRQLLRATNNFVDERTGIDYGSIYEFGPDKALVIDSLSGINDMALNLTVGFKPALHQGEWGVAQNLEYALIQKLTSDLKCLFVLVGHVDKEPNEITGGTSIMASSIGRKLAPKLGKKFSEVILAKRGTKGLAFRWSTDDSAADLKNRALPISDQIEPTFVEIWKGHQERLAQLGVAEGRPAV